MRYPKGGIAMSHRSGELLLKAIQSLPADEQEEVLVAVLGGQGTTIGATAARAEVGGPPPGLPGAPFTIPLSGEFLPEPGSRVRASATAGEAALRVLPVRLPAEEYERLRTWSREHDFSMAVIIRTLVERFLATQGVAAKEQPS
jgi:hypothetical protein